MTHLDDYAGLRAHVEQLSHDYYQLNLSTVTDDEFDRLVRKLAVMEHQLGIDDSTSPTRRVGGVSGTFAKTNHAVPMLSLDNVFTEMEIVDFFKRAAGPALELMVEPKIDGLSCAIIYADGKLVRAVTRGDGRVGDDVTANVMTIKNVPLEIAVANTVEIRGEVYMPKSVFAAIVKAQVDGDDEPFANARNAAAGSLKQKDSAVTARRGLKFIAYQVVGHAIDFVDGVAQLAKLRDMGFTTPLNVVAHPSGEVFNAVRTAMPDDLGVAALENDRHRYEFETDGAVLKVRNTLVREELGLGTKSPRWACALKFPPERKATRLLNVVCQVGRTGAITPVAEFEPVLLSGATVKRASLCNQDEVERLGIDIGDMVYVERSADVIPKVVGLAEKVHKDPGSNSWSHWTMPLVCPCCHTKLKKDEGAVAWYCPNRECPDQVFERLRHAVAKSALDLDGCGDAMVRVLMAAGVSDMAGIFEVLPASLCGVGDAALKKFLSERERAKKAPLWRKYHALGIELVGRTVSKELALAYPNIVALANARDLENRVGPVRAFAIMEFLGEQADMLERLDVVGFKFEEIGATVGTRPFTGRTLCITGVLVTGSREAVAAKIEAAGGLVKSSVGRKTDYLVVGDMPGQAKTKDAAKYGTKTITEDELYALLGLPMELAPDHDGDV